MPSEVIQANIDVHTRMADSYDRVEPHFRPENRAKVRKTLEELSRKAGGGKLLDLGCGTGFVIGLTKDLFKEVHGVDVTQAMLDRVDRSSGNITLHNSTAEKVPFADNYFDMATAYSFLHHTEDYRKVMRETARVLRPGGLFYVDLEPNKAFWDHLAKLDDQDRPFQPLVAKAVDAALHTDDQVQKDYGIRKETFQKAEYGKAILGGVDPREIRREFTSLGFKSCAVRLEWFLGQAEVMHGQSFEDAARVDAYLRSVGPLSDHLYKYVQIILTK
ncbi:MAG: class I SAM-dependent methyltransferase [Tepidisphaeraceae bacterium]